MQHYRPCRKPAASRATILSNYASIPNENTRRVPRFLMNPARLAPELSRLFPPGAVVAELREPGDPSLLLPAEAGHLGRSVAQRVLEFAAGRICARRALAEFGITEFALEVGAQRQPLWPESMAGSITHTAGFCAAAVAPRRLALALGIDCEVVGDIKREIWPRICLPGEIAWLRSLAPAERDGAAALIFSAKEAFYKCQFPMTRERLDFFAVSIEVPQWGGASGVFRVVAGPGTAESVCDALPMQGRYVLHGEFVTTGLAWLPETAQ
jgi:4'-phosphopantetheinyl transferase EntD